MKNTDIKGEKFLTEKERSFYNRRKDLDEFDEEMAQWRKEFKEKLKREEQERNG